MIRINLIHAALDAGNVDICLDGCAVLCDVAYGDYADFAKFAGCSYSRFEIKETGTSNVLVCVPCFSFPCEGNYSLVIHWNVCGDGLFVTCYDNCGIKGKGNFLFRHAAGVGKVNVCKTDADPEIRVYTDVCQGDVEYAANFPQGTNEVTIKLSADDLELVVKSDLEIEKDTLTILYLTGKTGSPDEFDTVVETLPLLPKCLSYWCDVYQGHC